MHRGTMLGPRRFKAAAENFSPGKRLFELTVFFSSPCSIDALAIVRATEALVVQNWVFHVHIINLCLVVRS